MILHVLLTIEKSVVMEIYGSHNVTETDKTGHRISIPNMCANFRSNANAGKADVNAKCGKVESGLLIVRPYSGRLVRIKRALPANRRQRPFIHIKRFLGELS